MGWGEVLSHQGVGPRFRKHRRIIQDQFSAKQALHHTHVLRKEAYATLLDLGNAPDDLIKHLKRSASVFFSIHQVPLIDCAIYSFSVLHSRSHRQPPDRFSTAAGIILNITYGYTVKDCDDPLVTLADECTSASVAAGGPGALFCDLVPARTFSSVLSRIPP